MKTRLEEHYHAAVRPALMEKFGYKNTLEVPKIEKIIINMGVGEAVRDSKKIEHATRDLAAITGQKPVVTRAKRANAAFKLRAGMPIGCKVTLRRDKMYEIMFQPTEERLVYLVNEFLKPENKRRKEIGQEPLGEFYSLRLGQIATAVEYITDNRYVLNTSATQFKFEVDSLEDSKYAWEKWNEYISKNNCDLTPCYDGLTVLYMLERRLRESTDDAGVAGDKSMPSVERCKDILAILQKL